MKANATNKKIKKDANLKKMQFFFIMFILNGIIANGIHGRQTNFRSKEEEFFTANSKRNVKNFQADEFARTRVQALRLPSSTDSSSSLPKSPLRRFKRYGHLMNPKDHPPPLLRRGYIYPIPFPGHFRRPFFRANPYPGMPYNRRFNGRSRGHDQAFMTEEARREEEKLQQIFNLIYPPRTDYDKTKHGGPMQDYRQNWPSDAEDFEDQQLYNFRPIVYRAGHANKMRLPLYPPLRQKGRQMDSPDHKPIERGKQYNKPDSLEEQTPVLPIIPPQGASKTPICDMSFKNFEAARAQGKNLQMPRMEQQMQFGNANCDACPKNDRFPSSQCKNAASDIANAAAAKAKAFRDSQDMAGAQAASAVHREFAERAIQSAKTAEAIFDGKRIVFERLKSAIQAAECQVKDKAQLVEKAQVHLNMACNLAQEAKNQLRGLINSGKAANRVLNMAKRVLRGARNECRRKITRIRTSKDNLGVLLMKLRAAREDYEKTRQITYKAICFAKQAQKKVQASRIF